MLRKSIYIWKLKFAIKQTIKYFWSYTLEMVCIYREYKEWCVPASAKLVWAQFKPLFAYDICHLWLSKRGSVSSYVHRIPDYFFSQAVYEKVQNIWHTHTDTHADTQTQTDRHIQREREDEIMLWFFPTCQVSVAACRIRKGAPDTLAPKLQEVLRHTIKRAGKQPFLLPEHYYS